MCLSNGGENEKSIFLTYVSILVLMDVPLESGYMSYIYLQELMFQSLF